MKTWRAIAAGLGSLALAGCTAAATQAADSIENGAWHVTLESGFMGVIELVLDFDETGDTITAHGDRENARRMASITARTGRPHPDWNARGGIASLQLDPGADGIYTGTLTTPFGATPLSVRFEDRSHFTGTLDSGSAIRGRLGGELPIRDYVPVADALVAAMHARLYDPSRLETRQWRAFEDKLTRLADLAEDDLTFFSGVYLAWDNAVFSHFRLWRPMISNADMFAAFETSAAEAPAARYETLEDGIGLITLDHFVGERVTAQVNAAFDAAAAAGVNKLVIDMRENGGGAFAALEVVDRLVAEDLEYGYFAGAPWWRQHDQAPTPAERASIAPFRGTTVAEFMDAVTADDLLVLRTQPQETRFEGEVAVLISGTTASAAELIAELLQRSGRATLIGTQTEGALLSGSFAELPDGFKLFLPVADYYTATGFRVEGHGLTPDIATAEGEDALATALAYLNRDH